MTRNIAIYEVIIANGTKKGLITGAINNIKGDESKISLSRCYREYTGSVSIHKMRYCLSMENLNGKLSKRLKILSRFQRNLSKKVCQVRKQYNYKRDTDGIIPRVENHFCGYLLA